jgi:hypothetical protein
MAALIKSGYPYYRYVMYETAGKKVKVYTMPRKRKQLKENMADFILFINA